MNPRVRRVATGLGRGWSATTLGLAVAFAAIVGVALWSAAVGRAVVFGSRVAGVPLRLLVVPALTVALGPVAGSVLYARYREFDLTLSGPRRGTWPTAVAVVVAPVLLAGAVSAVGNVAFGVSLSAMTDRWINPDVAPGFLASRVVLPAALLGIGYAFVVCGVVVESVRSVVDAGDVPPVAAALVGFFHLLPVDAVARLPLGFGAAYELLTSLVFGVAFGAGVGVVYRARESGRSVVDLERRDMAVLAVAAVGVAGVATGLTSVSEVVVNALWVVVLGLSIAGYHRTRSAWVAACSLAAFTVALRVLVYVESALGLAVA